jgi:hypothetical protein
VDRQPVHSLSLANFDCHWSMPSETANRQLYPDYTPDWGCLPTECLDWISSRFADLQNWCLQLS